MKRRIAIWLCALLLAAAVPALAQEAVGTAGAKSLLTEVYGYTAAEAEEFAFEVTETKDEVQVRFWPSAHPLWVYEGAFSQADGGFLRNSTPFESGYRGPMNECDLRDFLHEAQDAGWFTQWEQGRAALKAALDKRDTSSSLLDRYKAALESGELTAAGALNGYFQLCFGGEGGWSPALVQWRDAALAAFGLTAESGDHTARTYSVQDEHEPYTVLEFVGKTPEKLVWTHDKLEGWTSLGGAAILYDQPLAKGLNRWRPDFGLAAYGRGDERLLVQFARMSADEPWQAYPVGEKALLKGREVRITYDAVRDAFDIAYPISDAESERFRVSVRNTGNGPLCELNEYRRVNAETGEGVVIGGGRWGADGWYQVTTYTPGQAAKTESVERVFPAYLDYVDAGSFPKSAEECRADAGYVLPEGWGVTCGVHLRAKTSSRSTDLGTYHTGTLVQVLETLPGDPYPWAHVRIGAQEGYMSSVYVQYPGYECRMDPLKDYATLPVGKTRKKLALKKDTGWFDGTVMELPEGAKLHVLAERGDWLHVMVPQNGEPGWLMDGEGTDGYIKAADVVIAATALQLDWQ